MNKEKGSNSNSYNEKKLISLPYHIKAGITSEDPSFPITNLQENECNNGWISHKFCIFPQKMIIKFKNYVDLKQINILMNETKIPTIIQFINCIPLTENKKKNDYKYEKIGHIELSSNEESNYNSREYRKILVNLKRVKRIKILLFKNFKNSFNPYNQIGIVSLKFIGNCSEINDSIKSINNSNLLSEENKEEEEEIEENNEEEEKENLEYNENDNSEEEYKSKEIINKTNIIDIKSKTNVMKDNSIYKNNNSQNRNAKIIQEEQKNDSIYNHDMIRLIIEKIQKLNEELIKKRVNKEYSEYNKIQNDIESLEKLIRKIKDMKINNKSVQSKDLTYKKNKSFKINEFKYTNIDNGKDVSNKNSKYLKIKTINVNKNKVNLDLLSPLSKNFLPKITKRTKILSEKDNLHKNLNNSLYFNKDCNYLQGLSYDNLVHLEIKKNTNNNKYNGKKDHYYSLNNLNEEEKNMENEPILEELSPEIKLNNEFLINILGEEIIQKIYSNNIEYKEQGFDFLIMRVKDIIVFSPGDSEEMNKYIFSLFNIFIEFIDYNNSSIKLKCIDLFMNIIKAFKEKAALNNIEYNFQITKPIIYKLKQALNNESRIIEDKIVELYYNLLNSNLCDYNSLIIELIENEVNEYFYKLNILNHNDFSQRANSNKVGIGISKGMVYLNFNNNKNLVISIMKIFLKLFDEYEKYEFKKIDINKFPKTIVGDYIIMNLNHPNKEVVEMTKRVLIKYISIFGNQIFFKLELIIGKKDLNNIIQNNIELIINYRKYTLEKNNNNNNEKKFYTSQKKNNFRQVAPLILCMTNNLDKNIFYSPKNKSNIYCNKFNKSKSLIRNLSQPKLFLSKKSINRDCLNISNNTNSS